MSRRRQAARGEIGDGDELRRWQAFELDLLVAGAEEQRRPGLRAFRDRLRPRLHDRHLVVASEPPAVPARDLAALDAFYRQTGAAQWSWLGCAGGLAEAWAAALVPWGAVREEVVLMAAAASPADASWPEGITRFEGPRELARFLELRRAIQSPAETALREQALEALRLRQGRARAIGLLAVIEAGTVAASIALTTAGERAWLEDLETRPDRRGSGLGRLLFRAAAAEAARRGARAIGLAARAADWPWQWYQREGFAVVGRVVRLRRDLEPPAPATSRPPAARDRDQNQKM